MLPSLASFYSLMTLLRLDGSPLKSVSFASNELAEIPLASRFEALLGKVSSKLAKILEPGFSVLCRTSTSGTLLHDVAVTSSTY